MQTQERAQSPHALELEAQEERAQPPHALELERERETRARLDEWFGPRKMVGHWQRCQGAHGYPVALISSWLQKAIRRAFEEDACFAAGALYSFVLEESVQGRSIRTHLLSRLTIIALEDVGMGSPFLVDAVISKLAPLFDAEFSASDAKVILGVARRLASADTKRTRIGSWIKNAVCRPDPHPELGQFAYFVNLLKKTPAELCASAAADPRDKLNEGSPLARWLLDKSNWRRGEWVVGFILLRLRPAWDENLPPKIKGIKIETILAWNDPENRPKLDDDMMKIVYDKHAGKKNSIETQIRFAEEGTFVENELVPHPLYAVLRRYYVECSRMGVEFKGKYPPESAAAPAAPPHPLAMPSGRPPKRAADGPAGASAKARASKKTQKSILEFVDNDRPTDASLFEVREKKLLGFKKPAFVALLTPKGSVDGLPAGEKCFVKIDHAGALDFASRCAAARGALGMLAPPVALHRRVRLTYEYEAWAPLEWRGMVDRHTGALRREGGGLADVLFVKYFAGTMLKNATAQARVDLMELAKVLAFRRYVMCTDTNSSNIMVADDGGVLSVDENAPNAEQRRKCLESDFASVFAAQPSGNLSKDFTLRVSAAVEARSEEMSAFLERLSDVKDRFEEVDDGWLDRVRRSRSWTAVFAPACIAVPAKSD